MNACGSVWGVTFLVIPARRAVVRTIRPAPWRSSRRPSAARNTGPSVRSPIARAVRGASGTVTTLPPLRVTARVRCPRSRPRCSMSAPVASETRSPFSASSEISAYPADSPSHQQGAELVAVQGDGVGLVVDPRPADMGGRGAIEQFFLDRVLVEPGDGAQPPGDGGAGPASGFQVPGEALDVGAADGEQGHRAGPAPAGELAQVQGVGLPGQAAVPGQEPGEGESLGLGEGRLDRGERGGWAAVVIGHLPDEPRPGKLGQ